MKDILNAISDDLTFLCETLPTRRSGTAGNQAAADYIAWRMHGLGLEVEAQPFSCQAWECTRAELTVDGLNIPILANPFSLSCDARGSLLYAGTIEELEGLGGKGRLLVLYGDLTREPLACKGWFLKGPRDEQIVDLLETMQPAAVLAVQQQPGSINRIIEDADLALASATLTDEAARRLFRLDGADAHLVLETHSGPGSTANVVGRRPGTRPGDTTVLCAHYDSKIDTPGALDNAGGVACLLAAARMMQAAPTETTLEFVSFTNEEYLPIGDDTYLERAGEGFLDGVRLAINFDGAGNRTGVNTLAIFAASDDFRNLADTIKARYTGVPWTEPWPQSNHSTFAFRGVPALAISSTGAWSYAHQYEDTPGMVSPARLAEAARLAVDLALGVQPYPLRWLRAGNEPAFSTD